MTMWRARLFGALALVGASAFLAAAPTHAQVINATPTASFGPAQSGDSINYRVTWSPPQDGSSFVAYINIAVSGTQGGTALPVPGLQQCGPWGPPPGPTPSNGPAQSCAAPGFTPAYNGTYTAVSKAQGCNWFSPCNADDPSAPYWNSAALPTVTIDNPPTPPALTVSYDASAGRINASWSHDSNAADETFALAESVNGGNPAPVNISPTATSWSRGNLTPGDTYTFVVAADRPHPDGTLFPQEASDAQSASVPAPAADTTTTAAGSGGSGGGGTGATTSTTQKLLAPGLKPPPNYTPSKLDLSAFAKALGAAKAKGSAGGSGGDNGSVSGSEADNGYNQSLPYGSAPAASATEDGPQQAADGAALNRTAANGKDNVRTAAAVAGGLLAIVLAMHGMWLRSEVKRAALLEAVEPENVSPEFREFWLGSDGDPWGG